MLGGRATFPSFSPRQQENPGTAANNHGSNALGRPRFSVIHRTSCSGAPLRRLSVFLSLLRPALAFLLLEGSQTSQAAPNPVVVGSARFTVITPQCIRLEYAPDGAFVDAPSLFAANRAARFGGFRLAQAGKSTTIDTGAIRLTYTPDGVSFSGSNLRAEIKKGSQTAVWAPGASNPGNLGGTSRRPASAPCRPGCQGWTRPAPRPPFGCPS